MSHKVKIRNQSDRKIKKKKERKNKVASLKKSKFRQGVKIEERVLDTYGITWEVISCGISIVEREYRLEREIFENISIRIFYNY